MLRRSVVVIMLLATRAFADETAQERREIAEQIARGAIREARRAIAIGPTIGLYSAYAPSPGEFDGALSFGLEFELFSSKVLSPSGLEGMVRGRVQAKLERIVKERHGGTRPDNATMKQYVREVLEDVKAELLAELNAKPKKLQRPRFNLALEANRMFDAGDWLARIGFGVGIKAVSLGPTFSVRFGDDTVAQLGGELAIHVMPSKSLVFDLFLRGDFELHARETNEDQLVVGIRLLFDLI